MPDTSSTKKPTSRGKLDISFKKPQEEKQERYRYSYVPMTFYWIKDIVREFLGRKNFPDALAIMFAIFSVSIAFPFFPYVILIPLIAITFIVAMLSPLGGLMMMLFEFLLMVAYQAPLLAWILTILVSISLFLGYKHYRTITFIYVMMMLPLSYLGFIFEIPAFIVGSLFLGFRRALVSGMIILLLVIILSGVTGIQNSAPIVYDGVGAHAKIVPTSLSGVLTPAKNATTLLTFPAALGSAVAGLFGHQVVSNLFVGFGVTLLSMAYMPQYTIVQIAGWLFVVFAMSNFVIRSRSGFKGAEASFFSFILLGVYALLSFLEKSPINKLDVLSFAIAPALIFILELNNVEVVKALAVMKQDFLGKFGEAFQDLTSGTKETLSDVANYDETKKELREAVLAPIEHREISGAYKVAPTKGILLFGPPGTGKTLMMRALANEIRARFFYVKTSSLLSPFQGESAQALSKIFDTVRKNTPAILFFDEIDGIAVKREKQESDSNRQLISTLLGEMDGFQKIDGVVVVGSTNVPHMIDEGLLRPGRFDKIIYMPLPDKAGRAKIFAYYLSKLPVGDDVDYAKLSDMTSRFSGADIKNICNEAARQVADEAVRQRKVLQITMADVAGIIKATKPSTSLATLEKYNQFRIDYERRSHPELMEDGSEDDVKLDDVVGLEQAKKALYEAVEIPILHSSLVKKYDVKSIKGILLFGPPGTGKTMLMKAVANELEGVRLLIISGSDISKNGLDNALGQIRETFNSARENAPCIVFIDEMDALLPSRSGSSELAVHMTSEFLQQLDGIKSSNGVVIVGATNRPDKLDPAILRPGRMDKFIFVAPPNADERAAMFEENLKKSPIKGKMDYKSLAAASEGFTGADIANVCRQAKLEALEENISTSKEKKIDIDGLLKIIRSTKPSAPSSSLGAYMNFISLYGGR